MRKILSSCILASALLIGNSFVANGQQGASRSSKQKMQPAQKIDFGRKLYETKCASCHGLKGRGDGPVKAWLTKSPPDLSALAKSNGGILPVEAMYSMIEGTKGPAVHGTRDMPIWGPAFRVEAAEYYIDTPYDPEVYVRSRILALIEYINRLQVK
jgi:mono/diheme cytochrome c family protein